ncbi:MAG: hypothetical protein WEA24_00805 [Gemmatimonadota bacterium]
MERIFSFFFKYRPIVFQEGTLGFGAPVPGWVLLVAGGLVLGATAYTYARARANTRPVDRVVLAGLRTGVVALLLFALARPFLAVPTVVEQQNFVGVLIDDSRSMRVADEGEGLTRADLVRHAFGTGEEAGEIAAALAERFQVRYFGFSAETGRVESLDELGWEGTHTRVGGALEHARDDLSTVPLSGLVLVSDGADNSGEALSAALLSLKAQRLPVYTVGVGHEKFEQDIELRRVGTPRRVLEGAAVVADLVVAHSGYGGETVEVLVEDGGVIVGREEVELPAAEEPTVVRVHFTAAAAGARRFVFRVPLQDGELVTRNNEQAAVIHVEENRKKILYFEGEPRWEVGFMRRAVADDPNLQLVVLQRTAPDKYLRMNVDSATDLLGGFPTTREELFRYRGLVLGSVEASHFTHDQLRMIADFVGLRGGGFLMLGGRRAFAEGGWAGTPVADVLPVELDGATQGDTSFYSPVKVGLTRAGSAHPILRLADTDEASAEHWGELPELNTFNRVGRIKPGATALLTGRGDGLRGEQVVLAHQRFGRGVSMALPVENLWLWQMHADIPLEDLTHETFWRQLLRWLVTDVPGQVTVALASDRVAPGEPLELRATVDDETYLRVNDGTVNAHVISSIGEASVVPLRWTVRADGEYRGTFTAMEPGIHEIRVEATRPGSSHVMTDVAWVSVEESQAEYFEAQMRPAALRRIAEETGGRFYTPANLANLPEDISYTGQGITVIEERDLWNMPILFLLLIGLVGAEWAFRRMRGLA